MNSIVDKKSSVRIIKKYKISLLDQLYPNINLDRFKMELSEFMLLECNNTHYKYFFPPQLMGDGKFYEDLIFISSDTKYYPKWRWAHSKALKYINNQESILEIGSGGLEFISKLNGLGYNITGLEINRFSLKKAKELGINLKESNIEDFSKTNLFQFDIICFFEVLEHVYDVNSFFKSVLKCLKKGGKIIFSVPNNNSFIKHSTLPLNFPPHHMGLWDEVSIKNLEKVFDIKFTGCKFEPLRKSEINWFLFSLESKYLKNKLIKKLYYKFSFRNLIFYCVLLFRKTIKGQTILAKFEKV